MNTIMMKAVVAGAYGSPDVLKLKDVEKPVPKPGEVLVKVATASATTADTMMRTGRPYFARLFLGVARPGKPIPGTGWRRDVSKGMRATGDEVNSLYSNTFMPDADPLIVCA